jgi:anion-transporting  ArsA/GET3 family ATPase
VVLDRRLIILTGKGGVGRSALTAALGIRAARAGRRALTVGMTDGLGLASHLTTGELAYQPAEVRPGLWAMAIDPAIALDEYLRRELHLPRLGPVTGAYRSFAETVPGIRDVVVMGKVIHEARRPEWDVVIVDGPPIGQISSYLRAPSTIQTLVPAGRVERQATSLRSTLEDPTLTVVVPVTLAEELPVSETLEALAQINGERLAPVGAVVVNRVLPALELDDEAIERLAEGPERDAAKLHRGLLASQRRWLELLPGSTRLPYLFGLLTPAEAAARLADTWEEAP